MKKIPRKCQRLLARNSCTRQRLVNLWDDSVVVPRVWILNRQPGFQKESLVIIRLMSNYTDDIKIHMVVVIMDMTGDLSVTPRKMADTSETSYVQVYTCKIVTMRRR